jgi:hypothetical protein
LSWIVCGAAEMFILLAELSKEILVLAMIYKEEYLLTIAAYPSTCPTHYVN